MYSPSLQKFPVLMLLQLFKIYYEGLGSGLIYYCSLKASSYLLFQGQLYRQTPGTPMAPSLSAVVEDIFLKAFEALVLKSSE